MRKCGLVKSIFRHHHVHCLNNYEKMCIAAMIGWGFMKGVCVGMYLSRK